MKTERHKPVLIGALNILSLISPFQSNNATDAIKSVQKMEQLNIASVKSIESTWLKVPSSCKARGFNAEAKTLKNKEPLAHIQKIYSSYNV